MDSKEKTKKSRAQSGIKGKTREKEIDKDDFKTTNIQLSEKLVVSAMKLSNIKTKKDLVNKALEEYVNYLKRIELTKLRGKVKFFDGYENEV